MKRPAVSLTFERLDAGKTSKAGKDATEGAQRAFLAKMWRRQTPHILQSCGFTTQLAVLWFHHTARSPVVSPHSSQSCGFT
jgi:hypothetical protein